MNESTRVNGRSIPDRVNLRILNALGCGIVAMALTWQVMGTLDSELRMEFWANLLPVLLLVPGYLCVHVATKRYNYYYEQVLIGHVVDHGYYTSFFKTNFYVRIKGLTRAGEENTYKKYVDVDRWRALKEGDYVNY